MKKPDSVTFGKLPINRPASLPEIPAIEPTPLFTQALEMGAMPPLPMSAEMLMPPTCETCNYVDSLIDNFNEMAFALTPDVVRSSTLNITQFRNGFLSYGITSVDTVRNTLKTIGANYMPTLVGSGMTFDSLQHAMVQSLTTELQINSDLTEVHTRTIDLTKHND